MTKGEAINYFNRKRGEELLRNSNTNFSNINSRRPVWWMNIKLERLKEDINILLVGEDELVYLKIPANSFDPYSDFRIWEEKMAIDLYISSDKNDRYMKDISSGARGVDFKPFIKDRFFLGKELLAFDKSKKLQKLNKEYKRHHQPVKEIYSLTTGQKILKDGQTNITYQDLFADYLEGSNTIIIQDPYIRYPHQFKNLLEFCLMLGDVKDLDKTINLQLVTWNEKEFHHQSKKYFEEVVSSVKDLSIELSYKFENHHDRYIQTDTGWKIILGRGLDIFQRPEGRFSIADLDQKRRKCKPCEITYIKENH
ncbi:MAG: MIT C-terminal domain-containing protein [Gillisia sp.]